MFGQRKLKPVAEYQAQSEIDRVYHEVRQTLRVTGVNLNFRTWANFEKFMPQMWDAMRQTCETRAFEDAADQIRSEAVSYVPKLGVIQALARSETGESQAWQIRRALRLYHYINPKLLVFTAALHRLLKNEIESPVAIAKAERIERGIPRRMYPMEMVAEDVDDAQLQSLFTDMKSTMGLENVNSDYRTLALWPHYMECAWSELKPITVTDEFQSLAEHLLANARTLALQLPFRANAVSALAEDAGSDLKRLLETIEQFEGSLPRVILNIALLSIETEGAAEACASPYPARARVAQ